MKFPYRGKLFSKTKLDEVSFALIRKRPRTWRNFKRPLEGEGRGGRQQPKEMEEEEEEEVKAEFKVTRDIVT